MEQIFKELVEIGYVFPAETEFVSSKNRLKVNVLNGRVRIDYANIRDVARAGLILKTYGTDSDYVIEEKNEFKDVCLMVDCSRNAVKNIQTVKKLIRNLAMIGYTSLMLYTEDTYEVENEPMFGYLRGRYTKAEMKELDAYANQWGIELIPCIQTLAHLNQLTRYKYSHFKCFDCEDILFVGEERTYALIDNMFKTLSECYASRRIHIGMDEAWLLGRGKYLNKNGLAPRFEILCVHLQKICEIARKYGLKPIMWSDMFWRTAIEGRNGHDKNDEVLIPQEILNKIPKEVTLCHWDYHYVNAEEYGKLLGIHKQFNNEIWFAGGTVEDIRGFIPHLTYSNKVAKAAIEAAKSFNIKSLMETVWGDNGGECSLFATLPAIMCYSYTSLGLSNERLEREFQALTGYDYNEYMRLEEAQTFGKYTEDLGNPSKYGLYNDVFLGYADTAISTEDKKYFTKAKQSIANLKNGQYGYVFESAYDLNAVLELKYDMGLRLRKAYQEKDKTELNNCADDLLKTIGLLEKFIESYRKQWLTENKPNGLEVQEIRLCGLKGRLIGCRERLIAYLNGEIEEIPELNETLLEQAVSRKCAGNRLDLFSHEAIASVGAFDGYTEVDV
ncbi:MAG: beta-N-acetylhexosaminidase [Clostridiales bacterium]|nr:beta-N-acetylhexosaminidase [Clostridiales bacterium]MBE5754775.1 beta-N-acetylhexosaminidase [Clostridiales bacterium]